MANDDFEDVRIHTTQAFEAIERGFSRLNRKVRYLIRLTVCGIFFLGGFITSSVKNNVPTEGVIEKVAAQPDLTNKCKGRYDRPMEYAIMHECVFSKGTPRNEKMLLDRINYCSCALERVQKKKPYQKMFENNLEDFTFKIREENLCRDSKLPPVLEEETTK